MSNQEDFEIEDLATECMENIVLTQTDFPIETQVTTTQTDCPVETQVTTTQTECSVEPQVTPTQTECPVEPQLTTTQTECPVEPQVTTTQTECPVETEPKPETTSETTSEDSDDYIDTMYLVSVDNEPKFVFNSKKVARKFMEIKALEIADSCILNDTSIQTIFISEEDVDSYTISAYYKFVIVQYEVKLHSVSLSTVQKVLF